MSVSRTKLVGVALVIVAATVWLFWPSVHGEYLSGDDVTDLRQAVRVHGLTWNAVTWAFTCTDDYYRPLPRLFYVLSYQICGKNVAGHHAASVFLHALNVVLVFGFLWTLLRATSLTPGERLMVALWVAVVFAIHPLQTESVAWIAVHTQLLCMTFGLGSLWAYAGGARRWVVWGLYVAALLCKPMAVSVPFVMLAMDYYPLQRQVHSGWRRLVWEKAAMIALAVAVSVATMITKSQKGQMVSLTAIPLSDRVLLAFESLTFYPLKLAWPAHLSPYYPMPLGLSLFQWPVLLSVLAVLIATFVVARERRRIPMAAAAWGAYGMLVLPVSGLMPIGSQVVAMRYAYLAMLPALLVASAAGVWLWRRSTMTARIVLVGLLAGQLSIFGARTRMLIPLWHDDETDRRASLAEFPTSEIMNRTFAMMLLDQGRANEALPYAQRDVEIAPKVSYSHMTLGLVLRRLGRRQEALVQDEQALQLNPHSPEAHYNFGVALMELDKLPEAAEHFQQALQIKPDTPSAHNNLGSALYRMGRMPEAIEQFEAELKINPDYADAHDNLGTALAQTGRIKEAIAQFQQSLQITPDSALAHYNLAVALAQTGNIQEAITHYERAVRIKPDYAEAHINLGVALRDTGKTDEAIAHFEQALRIKPDSAEAHNYLGIALAQTGKFQEAIGHYKEALRLKPDYAEAQNNLGIDLAQTGKIEEAIAHYEQALRIKPDYVNAHFNLAVVLENSGRTREALDHYRQALKLQPDFAPASNAVARLQAGR